MATKKTRTNDLESENIKEKDIHSPNDNIQMSSHFLSGIIHEIRTPMNAIVGFSQLLEAITDNQEQLDYIHKIQDASKHLLDIVNDALDLSKIESGRVIIEERPFSLNGLISSVIDLFQDSVQQKKIYLDIENLNAPQRIIGDQARIRQILVNLISNAVKFTDQGGVSIVLSSVPILHSERVQLIIKIKDTGIGMTVDQQNRLFQDYAQANRSITRLFGGTGLGLSISQKLAHLMHGTISASGRPNEGSVFTLELPVKLDLESSEIILDRHESLPVHLKLGSRILISEDHLLSLKLAQRILTNFGLIVDSVTDGKKALEFAQKNTYDLIILDLETPLLNGIDVAKNIRTFNTVTPILALTAHQISDVQTSCRDAGINDIIQKPIDHQSLHQALIKWLPLQ